MKNTLTWIIFHEFKKGTTQEASSLNKHNGGESEILLKKKKKVKREQTWTSNHTEICLVWSERVFQTRHEDRSWGRCAKHQHDFKESKCQRETD